MIKTILVPTDGSDHAEKAVALASDIAEKYGARLVFLHVVQHGPLPESLRHMADVEHVANVASSPASVPFAAIPTVRFPAGVANRKEDTSAEIHDFVGRQALRRAEEIAKGNGVKVTKTVMEDGDPVRLILDQADREGANLIIMGCRGLSDLKGLLMGSVSHKVSHLANCTCVTVK